MKPIAIYGAGGFAREVLGLIEDINTESATWEIVGFLDDGPEPPPEVHGYPVFAAAQWLESHARETAVVLGMGSPAVKRRIAAATAKRVEFPTLIHPSVVRSRRVSIGVGVVITAGNILTTDIHVGDFAMLNLACTVGHDDSIGAYCTLSPGVNVSGHVQIGLGTDVGTGAKIIPGLTIGEWSMIGAGAVVVRDLPANCTAVGVPAAVVKQRQPGWHE